LRPIESVEPEIVSQLRIGARVEEEWNEMRVAEDCGEDQRCLSAAGAFVGVSPVSEHGLDDACVAGGYGLR